MAVEVGNRPFVGRVETVEALHRRFEDARAGSGGVTLLVGDTGVGKSRLVAGLVRDMRSRGARVLEGTSVPADEPPPFGLLRSALESVPPPAAGGDRAVPAPPSVGVIIGFAPGLDDRSFGGSLRIEERLLATLGEANDREEGLRGPLGLGIVEQFFELTRHGPAVLVLEDIHRADEPSLEAIEIVARQIVNRPLWILATVRPYPALTPSRRARLEAFERSTQASRITLGPLTSSEVAEFLRNREPEREFSDEEIARRYSETGGNPLLLEQLDRRLPDPAGGAQAGSAPDLPVAAEVDRPALDDDEERTLAVAAAIGPEVPFELLLKSSGEDEERLAESVDGLVARGLLLEREGEVLTFSDDRVRAEIYDELSESRRRVLHRRVGEALEAMGGADLATIFALARHFYLGKIDERAYATNRVAAEIAARLYAPGIAREHLERALECFRRLRPDDLTVDTELVVELAQQVDAIGELEEAERLLKRQLGRPGLPARIPRPLLALSELYLARIQANRGNWAAAEEAATRILGRPELLSHPLVLLALRRLRGESLYYQGRYADALAEHTEGLRLAREAGNRRETALGQARRARVLAMIGRADEALAEGGEAARELEKIGDLREASHAHLFLGVVTANRGSGPGRIDGAIAEFLESTRLAEKAHDLRRVGWGQFNTADILREAGRLDEAAELNRRAREVLERVGDRFGLVQSMVVSGKIALDRRQYDLAEADLLDAYRLVRELRAPADEVDVVLRLAQLSLARGDRASARRRAGDLERQGLAALRPDLAADFEILRRALATEGRDGTDGAPR